MNIKEASMQTGVGEHMLRHYEKLGIIKPNRNPDNNYRDYSTYEITTIVMVKQYSELGIPLKTIRDMVQEAALDKTLSQLDTAVERLIDDVEWSRARLFHAKNLQQLFRMIKEGRPSDILEAPDSYFYPRQDARSQDQYTNLYAKSGAVMPAFRIPFDQVGMEEYPANQGMLSTKLLPDHGYPPVLVPAHTIWRTIRRLPSDHLINRNELEPILKQLSDEGYTLSGDIFLYQVMSHTNDNREVTVTIECEVNGARNN